VKHAETFVLEAPYPVSASELCTAAGIPPTVVTHVLLLVDALAMHEDPFAYGITLEDRKTRDGVTGYGLGFVGGFDPASFEATVPEELGTRALSQLTFIEAVFGPVPYLATSSVDVISRGKVKLHELEDGAALRYGVDE